MTFPLPIKNSVHISIIILLLGLKAKSKGNKKKLFLHISRLKLIHFMPLFHFYTP